MLPVRPQGQPAVMLASILLGWVAVRVAMLVVPLLGLASQSGPNPLAAPTASPRVEAGPGESRIARMPNALAVQALRSKPKQSHGAARLGQAPASAATWPTTMWPGLAPAPAPGHDQRDRAAPVAAAAAAAHWPAPARWSGDGWLLVRGTGAGPAALAPRYGASQIGAIGRLRLAGPWPGAPFVYLRATAATAVNERDVAAGLSVRPMPDIPLDIAAEARLSQRGARAVLRPAVGVVAALPRQGLPLGLSAEAYAQGGWVGGPGESLYGDAQVHLGGQRRDRAGRHLGGGLGLWAGAQRGAGRVDLGPAIALTVPLGGQASGRIEADWRFRIAGRATPGSGPALVLAISF